MWTHWILAPSDALSKNDSECESGCTRIDVHSSSACKILNALTCKISSTGNDISYLVTECEYPVSDWEVDNC